MLAFGMPMGPIELADTVGLDVAASVGRELSEFLKLEIPEGIEGLLASGKRGKKDGEGFYKWENGKPVKPEVDPSYVAPADTEDRMILPFLNEAVAALHHPEVGDINLVWGEAGTGCIGPQGCLFGCWLSGARFWS